jgi:hypothetical protein
MTLKISPTPIGTANTEIYTAGAGLEGSIHGLVFSNNSDSPALVSILFYKSLDDNEYILSQNFPIGGRKNFVWPRPLNVRSGDRLSASASSNNVIFATASVYEAETFSQGFNVSGEWNDAAEYNVNDVVTYENVTYVAINSNNNSQPDLNPSDWVILVAPGPTGFTGSIGFTGSQGGVGFTGSRGDTGFTGSIGFTGSQGVGFTGSRGDTGFTGSRGDTGFTGSVGFTGSQGTGFTGSQGNTGDPAPRATTLETPSSTEKVPLFFNTSSFNLTQIRSVLTGSSSPSVTFSIRYGTDLSAAGTEVVTSGITCANTTGGVSTTSFNNGTIPANNFVWITTSAVSGNVTALNVSLF